MAKSKNVIKKTTYETTAQALNRKLGYARYQGFEVGKSIALQQSIDIVLIVLHEDFGYGPERCKQFHEKYMKAFQEMLDIAKEDTEDGEYTKEVLDRRLKAACPPEEFKPYAERYEYDLDPETDYTCGGKFK